MPHQLPSLCLLPQCSTLQNYVYRQVSNIRRTFVGKEIVDHSDVVGASPVGAAPTTSSFSTLTPGFNGLGKDNYKMRRETFKFWDLVRLILETLRYYTVLAILFRFLFLWRELPLLAPTHVSQEELFEWESVIHDVQLGWFLLQTIAELRQALFQLLQTWTLSLAGFLFGVGKWRPLLYCVTVGKKDDKNSMDYYKIVISLIH